MNIDKSDIKEIQTEMESRHSQSTFEKTIDNCISEMKCGTCGKVLEQLEATITDKNGKITCVDCGCTQSTETKCENPKCEDGFIDKTTHGMADTVFVRCPDCNGDEKHSERKQETLYILHAEIDKITNGDYDEKIRQHAIREIFEEWWEEEDLGSDSYDIVKADSRYGFKAGYKSRDKEIDAIKCCGNCKDDYTGTVMVPYSCVRCSRCRQNRQKEQSNDNWHSKVN